MRATLALAILSLAADCLAGKYTCGLHTSGNDFVEDFEFEAIPDPTNGRVNYVDRETADSLNLTSVTDSGTFILRADSTSVLDPNGAGRNSVRLKSKMEYRNHVAVFDINHIPTGCGTWPSISLIGPNWPHGGEIDILEGVNDVGPNAVTLHTGEGCVVPREGRVGQRADSTVISETCDVSPTNNVGCPTRLSSPSSFGPAFNKAGGGWYAIERSSEFIKVWFWSRGDEEEVPEDVKEEGDEIDTDTWGEPVALFPGDECPIDEKFGAQSIVIGLTFCGDWAGKVYTQNGCPGDCISHVNSNPESFKDAYFEIVGINTYFG